ncbi:MAG: DUF4372 domain-containing protein [Planctomycetota bacterium]|jgi:hypothetical protein|nr:DUF4372 domain-containing protein [Planctomycetota bacterium]
MYEGQMLFSQIMDFLPRKAFDRCVAKYNGDQNSKGFSCRDQFLSMAFAQLTLREGLRGIQGTLRANSHCLYHMGFRCKTISRNALAHANRERPWQIYAEFAMALMKRARKLYQGESLAVDLDANLFALDSTTIDLCLARFPWTPSQQSSVHSPPRDTPKRRSFCSAVVQNLMNIGAAIIADGITDSAGLKFRY